MNPFPSVVVVKSPGGDSPTAAAGSSFPQLEPMKLRHFMIWISLCPFAYAVAWLICWVVCEFDPAVQP